MHLGRIGDNDNPCQPVFIQDGDIMDDPDPVMNEKTVPSYETVEQKIKEYDNTIIVYRIFYFFNTFMFRFQLIKKDKMCSLEIPRNLLENLHSNGGSADQELNNLLDLHIEDAECWADFEA